MKPSTANSGYTPEPSSPRPLPVRAFGPQYRVEIHKTRPPRRRTINGRISGDRKGRAAWSTTFFASLLQRGLLAYVAKQARHHLIGQMLEGVMDLDFNLTEAGWVVPQLLQPTFLEGTQILSHLVKNRRGQRNG